MTKTRIEPSNDKGLLRGLIGIRGRLFLLLSIVLVPVLLVEAVIYYQRFEARKAEELQANLELARSVSRIFEAFIQDLLRSELLVGLALTSSQPITDRDRDRILDEFQKENPEVRSIFWINPRGIVVASSLKSYVGGDVSGRSFYEDVKAGRDWRMTDLIVGRVTQKPTFTIGRGIRNAEGKLLGIVAASVEPDRLDRVLAIDRAKERA